MDNDHAEEPFTWDDLDSLFMQMQIIAHMIRLFLGGGSQETGDLVNSVVLDLWKTNPKNWVSVGYFIAAFRQATRRKTIDFWRARQVRIPAEAIGMDIEAIADAYTGTKGAELHEGLEKLAAVNEVWARVLGRHFLLDVDVETIATEENMTAQEVYRLMPKARMALRVILEGG